MAKGNNDGNKKVLYTVISAIAVLAMVAMIVMCIVTKLYTSKFFPMFVVGIVCMFAAIGYIIYAFASGNGTKSSNNRGGRKNSGSKSRGL